MVIVLLKLELNKINSKRDDSVGSYMRSVSVTLWIADQEKVDPMPFRSLNFPVKVMIKSDSGYSFKLDLAGGWYLEIKLTNKGVVEGF